MKLLYINNNRIPTEEAGGQQIMKMCEAFANAGWEVEMLAHKRFNPIKHNPFQYYGVRENFTIKKIFCMNIGFLDKYLVKLSFYLRAISFSFASLFYIKDCDFLYTRDKFVACILCLLGKDFFLEVHGLPFFMFLPFYKKAKKIIVTSSQIKLILIAKGFSAKNILIARNAVDLSKFNISLSKRECRAKLNLPQDKKIVLYSGHFRSWKGIYVLAESSKYFSKKNIEIYCVGGKKNEIQKFQLNVSGLRLNIVSHCSPLQIPYWLKSADVLVLPNSAKKGDSIYGNSIPLKLFEYMASKTPIIASNLLPIREILNNKNSVLVEPDNSHVLALGIKKILQDDDWAAKISYKAFQDIQKYSWDNRARKILEFFNKP